VSGKAETVPLKCGHKNASAFLTGMFNIQKGGRPLIEAGMFGQLVRIGKQ
jgi:hypothetical protein